LGNSNVEVAKTVFGDAGTPSVAVGDIETHIHECADRSPRRKPSNAEYWLFRAMCSNESVRCTRGSAGGALLGPNCTYAPRTYSL
jgi:hypothetical protein